MHLRVVQRILGLLLMLYSVTMLPPVAVSVYFGDGQARAFIEALGITFMAGLVAWITARNDRRELRLRDGFLVAAVFWLGLGSVRRLAAAVGYSARDVGDRLPYSRPSRGSRRRVRPFLPDWIACPDPSSITGPSCTGWEAWASSCSRLPSCPCSA